VTPELEAEGVRNDFVRLVQQARKDAGLHVSDRIALSFEADEETAAVLSSHAAYVQAQALATTMTRVPAVAGEAAAAKVGSGDGKPVRILVQKV
jgi:isoleucyl-tRNA synthetase